MKKKTYTGPAIEISVSDINGIEPYLSTMHNVFVGMDEYINSSIIVSDDFDKYGIHTARTTICLDEIKDINDIQTKLSILGTSLASVYSLNKKEFDNVFISKLIEIIDTKNPDNINIALCFPMTGTTVNELCWNTENEIFDRNILSSMLIHFNGNTYSDRLLEIINDRKKIDKTFANKLLNKPIRFYHNSAFDDDHTASILSDHGYNSSLYFLGRGIENMMSNVDLVVFVGDTSNSKGCKVEKFICETYNIPFVEINDLSE